MEKEKLTIREVQNIETYILGVVSSLCEKNGINYSLYCGSILGCVRHSGSIPWDTDVDIIISTNDYERFIQIIQQQLPSLMRLQYYPSDKQYCYVHPRIGIKGIDIRWVHVDIFMYSGLPDEREEQLIYIQEARRLLCQYQKKSDIIFTKGNRISNILRTVYHYFRSLTIPGTKQNMFESFMKYAKRYDPISASYITEIGCNQYGEKKIFPSSMFQNTVKMKYEEIEVRIPAEYTLFLKTIYGNWEEYPSIEEQNCMAKYSFWADSKVMNSLRKKGIFDC